MIIVEMSVEGCNREAVFTRPGSFLRGSTLKLHCKELTRVVGILQKWAIRHLLTPDSFGFQRHDARLGLIAHLTELGECDWEAFFTAGSEMRFSLSREDSCAAACRSGPARVWEVQG